MNRRTFLGAAAALVVVASVPWTGIGAVQARTNRLSVLTTRQRQVALLMAKGLANREIARSIGKSTRTLDNHVQQILVKLNLPSRTAAVGLVRSERSL